MRELRDLFIQTSELGGEWNHELKSNIFMMLQRSSLIRQLMESLSIKRSLNTQFKWGGWVELMMMGRIVVSATCIHRALIFVDANLQFCKTRSLNSRLNHNKLLRARNKLSSATLALEVEKWWNFAFFSFFLFSQLINYFSESRRLRAFMVQQTVLVSFFSSFFISFFCFFLHTKSTKPPPILGAELITISLSSSTERDISSLLCVLRTRFLSKSCGYIYFLMVTAMCPQRTTRKVGRCGKRRRRREEEVTYKDSFFSVLRNSAQFFFWTQKKNCNMIEWNINFYFKNYIFLCSDHCRWEL